ncbi:hypothetical protein GCM10010435_78850 [Winogradskya consettensis]|uniref:Uncharacterized protein n=1 Tax=Winogradskya consettensis TaxID=113560 RepID=A0A919SV25_9ACTN|nr:hypothetical protein Aco04nite_56100 [Actinoplanes consettensis]
MFDGVGDQFAGEQDGDLDGVRWQSPPGQLRGDEFPPGSAGTGIAGKGQSGNVLVRW